MLASLEVIKMDTEHGLQRRGGPIQWRFQKDMDIVTVVYGWDAP